MASFEIGESCWIWKDGHLLHDYVAMQDGMSILTAGCKAVRRKEEVFKSIPEGIEWMERCLYIMKNYKPKIGEQS